MMSALNITNTSLHPEVISDEIQIFTYCEVGLSILTIIADLTTSTGLDPTNIHGNSGLPDSTN